jgi:hypothetical protein
MLVRNQEPQIQKVYNNANQILRLLLAQHANQEQKCKPREGKGKKKKDYNTIPLKKMLKPQGVGTC